MRLRLSTLVLLFFLPGLVLAETAYVTDRLFVSIREAQVPESPALKSVATGTEVEVLQRADGFAQVRIADGTEGWIAERYLVASAPPRAMLDTANAELKQARSELATTRQQLAAAQNSAKQAAQKVSALEQQLQAQGDMPASGTGDETAPEEVVPSTMSPDVPGDGFRFSWLWLLIAFAMLITGFVSGALWLREVNRKKMGGMYLRI